MKLFLLFVILFGNFSIDFANVINKYDCHQKKRIVGFFKGVENGKKINTKQVTFIYKCLKYIKTIIIKFF